MYMWLVLLLQIAFALKACAYDGTELENALSQKSGLMDLTTKAETHLQANDTVMNELEGTQISKLLQTDQELALEQVDQLSLVTRYAGTGYNLIKGNPEGDFNHGGIDPGVKVNSIIFAHTYTRRKRAYYRGKAMQVPDQVNFHMSHSCASSHSVQAYSGRKSYMKELETSVSISGRYRGLFASVSFSLSHGMARAEAATERQKRIIIQKTKICNLGQARYLYENAVARDRGYTLSRSFQNSVKYQLPTTYNQHAYMNFIEKWGTHIIAALEVGTRHIFKSSSTYKEVYKYLKKRHSLSSSVSGRYGNFRSSVSFSLRTLNENINQNSRLGRKTTEFTIGSQGVPLPIHLNLKLLNKALDSYWWGGVNEWRRNGIDKKQVNLVRALREYPHYVRAKKNTDPIIRIKLSIQWPDGTYALPMPTSGCPPGWSKGWRYQDTEDSNNKNRKTPGMEFKMRVWVSRDIKFYYCVKTVHGNSGIQWPRGTYCIAKKGGCPRGFGAGSIFWDDEDRRNKNGVWGILPDGRYGRDTEVQYCCRSDMHHRTVMHLPTIRPFILYRYGGECQYVQGMQFFDYYIKWDDEDRNNKDRCSGRHPDATCRRDQVLHVCYYQRW